MKSFGRRQFLTSLTASTLAAKAFAGRLFGQMGGGGGTPRSAIPAYRVQSPNLTVELSSAGKVVGVVLGKNGTQWPMAGQTSLAGCHVEGPVQAEERKNGGVRFTKKLVGEIGGTQREVKLVEDFFPTKDSVRWEIRLDGQGPMWSTPIETHLEFSDVREKQFWTPWGSPRPDPAWMKSAKWPEVFNEALARLDVKGGPRWDDPLRPAAFIDRTLYYGVPYYRYDTSRDFWYMPIFGDIFCIPLATVVDERSGGGMSLALSPENTVLDMTMETTAAGGVKFSRLFRRISQEGPVEYSMDLTAHEPSWRGGLRWMTNRYPDFFIPPMKDAGKLGGTAAYSTFEGEVDAEKYKRMAFTVNWKVIGDCPYEGMFIPPVPDGGKWLRMGPWGGPSYFLGPFTSAAKMAGYSRRMRQAGFYVLNYYNAAEFGRGFTYPAPPFRRPPSDPDFWKSSTDFLYGKLSGAIILHSEKAPPEAQWQARCSIAPGPFEGAAGSTILDCGESSWQEYLLDQARKLIQQVPDSSGICIDRLDFVRLYNFQRDDGVTYYDGPACSLVTSWKDFMERLGPIQHDAGQVLFVNNHVKRLDIVRQADGFFDEHSDFGPSKNLTALLGIFKPTIGWVRQADVFEPDPDTFMQRFLYLGTFPMAPFPHNDHSILPSEEADKIYTDYGPLFEAMRGRKWVLQPHDIQIDREGAKANLFTTPDGYAMPVLFGGSAASAALTVRGIPEVAAGKELRCEVIHPGETAWKPCAFRRKGSAIALKVPLTRGCALLRLHFGARI